MNHTLNVQKCPMETVSGIISFGDHSDDNEDATKHRTDHRHHSTRDIPRHGFVQLIVFVDANCRVSSLSLQINDKQIAKRSNEQDQGHGGQHDIAGGIADD